MVQKTYRKKRGGVKTRKQNVSTTSRSSLLASFQKQVTMKFFEMLLMVKLFHWKTHSYATHKATDELYSQLNKNMDKFMEVLLGKSGIRMNFMNQKTVSLIDLDSSEKLIEKVNEFKSYLVDLTNNKAMLVMSNTDLLNIRDEILGDMNQFLYLLSLH
jgi:DNA-binding ferritin-like protein